MLQLSGMLIGRPIMSLRTGTQIAETTMIVINPNNLKVEGFYCQTTDRQQLVLISQDIRDVLPQGIVVNDADVLTEPDELVRLKGILEINFQLIGKHVETTGGQKLGKVTDFATEIESMMIKKVYASQSLFKNFTGGNLGIDRTQIVEITDKKIVVHELTAKVPAHAGAVPA